MFLLMKNWELPQELAPLSDYTARMRARDSWSGTSTAPSSIVDQWRASDSCMWTAVIFIHALDVRAVCPAWVLPCSCR